MLGDALTTLGLIIPSCPVHWCSQAAAKAPLQPAMGVLFLENPSSGSRSDPREGALECGISGSQGLQLLIPCITSTPQWPWLWPQQHWCLVPFPVWCSVLPVALPTQLTVLSSVCCAPALLPAR